MEESDRELIERLNEDADGIEMTADERHFPAHFLERAQRYADNAREAASRLEALSVGVGRENGSSVAESGSTASPKSDGLCKSEEFRHWYEIVRDWSGSAFLAGEKVENELPLKSALYRDLCRLGNYLSAWADEAETLTKLAARLDDMATDRQAWADHPGIGGDKPPFANHLRGKRYGYSHAAQLIRAALSPALVSGGGEDEGVSCTESTDAPCSASSAAAEATPCKSEEVRYGKWRIFYDPPPIPTRSQDWGFAHDDFDASWEGEEDGYVSNGLAGRGASIADCKAQIDDMEADRA